MSDIFQELIPAIIVGVATVLGGPAGASAALLFLQGFATTLVLTEVSKFLAPDPPNVNSSLISRTQSLRTPIGSRQIIYGQVRVGGELTFAQVVNYKPNAFTNNQKFLFAMITFTGHEVQEIGDIWFDGEVVPLDGAGAATGRLAGFATVEKKLGTDDDAAPVLLMTYCGVPATMRQRGCSGIVARLTKNNDLYPNGVPNISGVLKGAKCFDPRTGLTVWTQNAALCINHYLCLPKKRGGMGCDYATEIDAADLIAAANVCDQDVALAAGGTEKRYTINGAFLVNADPKSVLQTMLGAMAGTAICIGGVWHLRAGAYITPTVTLNESHARGTIRTQTRMSRSEVFNGVKGVYISPVNKWQPTDFTPIINATYLAEDGAERLWKDVQFQFTTSHARAQRLARIELERSRQQITEEFPANLMGLQVQAGDTVYRNSTAKGWVSKPFDVINSKFVIYDDAQGVPTLGVDLKLRETASTVFDWNSGLETVVDPAPDSTLPNPFSPAAPGIVSVVETLYETTGSAGVKALATVTLGVQDDGSNPDYQLSYRVSGATVWVVQPVSKDVAIVLRDLEPAIYEFRARTFNSLGVASVYSATLVQQLFGLTAPPGDVQNFGVRAIAGQAVITFTQTVDLDVRQGGRVIVRFSGKTAGATWNDGTMLSPPDSALGTAGWPGDSVTITAPLYGGTYMAKFRDSTGNVSVNAASFVVTEALLAGFVTLATVTESPTFVGAKTNVVATDNALKLDSLTLWDTLGPVDSLTTIDSLGGLQSSGSYTFASTLNLGSLKTVRLAPNIQGVAFDTFDTWDDRTTLIDTWGLVDGNVIEDAEVTLWVRTTTTDPTGSPVWGAWHTLPGPADYALWGAQFRLDFISGNPTHNRQVTTLSVAARQ